MKVIEATNNVIVGHGDLDMVLIANGTLLTLNNLTWNGQQGFSEPPIHPLYVSIFMQVCFTARVLIVITLTQLCPIPQRPNSWLSSRSRYVIITALIL